MPDLNEAQQQQEQEDAYGGITLTNAERAEAADLGIDPEVLRAAKFAEFARTAKKTGWTVKQVAAFGELAAQRKATGHGVRLADMVKVRGAYGSK